MVLKDEKPYTDKPNAHLAPIDFENEFAAFQNEFDHHRSIKDFLSFKLYPKVYRDFYNHFEAYGAVRMLPSPSFFYGLKPNEEILVALSRGKNVLIKYLNMTEPNELGNRLVFFNLNGQTRPIEVKDKSLESKVAVHQKAVSENEIGSPLQGSLSQILVKEGDEVKVNSPLFIIEAMKMESTTTSPIAGVIVKIHLKEKTLVEQDDMVIELGKG